MPNILTLRGRNSREINDSGLLVADRGTTSLRNRESAIGNSQVVQRRRDPTEEAPDHPWPRWTSGRPGGSYDRRESASPIVPSQSRMRRVARRFLTACRTDDGSLYGRRPAEADRNERAVDRSIGRDDDTISEWPEQHTSRARKYLLVVLLRRVPLVLHEFGSPGSRVRPRTSLR